MATFSVCCSARQESVLAIGGKITKIALRRCTPPESRDAFSEKFSASTGSSKEKAGLNKKMKNNNYYDDIIRSL